MSYRICFYEACKGWNHQVKTIGLLDWGESLEILTLSSVSAYAIDEGSMSSIDYWAVFESQEVGGNLIGEARGNGWSGISGMVSNMVSMCLMPSHQLCSRHYNEPSSPQQPPLVCILLECLILPSHIRVQNKEKVTDTAIPIYRTSIIPIFPTVAKLSKTPGSLVIDCSLCYHMASSTGAPSLGPRGS